MAIDENLKAALVCPQCKGELSHREDPEQLICGACQLGYPVDDGIPVMLIDEAVPLGDG